MQHRATKVPVCLIYFPSSQIEPESRFWNVNNSVKVIFITFIQNNNRAVHFIKEDCFCFVIISIGNVYVYYVKCNTFLWI